MKTSSNIQTVLDLLKNEVDGDVSSALKKMANEYSMTWMYKGKKTLFPKTKINIEAEMREVYVIKGRKYEIKNIAEGDNLVMLELIESYSDPKTGKLHQTPLTLVLEMENGKVKTGRHYCDPQISHEELTQDVLDLAYENAKTKILIE